MGKNTNTKPHKDPTRSTVSLEDMMNKVGISSFEDLSEASGVSLRSIFNCRRKLHKPNNGTIHLLATALRTQPNIVRSALNA